MPPCDLRLDWPYDEALLEFFASNRLVRNRNVIYNVASTFEALARWDEAYRYYAEYLVTVTDAGERGATEAKLTAIAPHVALLEITTAPPGATVYLDRRDLGGRGETPLVLALPPGPHVVLFERAGFEPASAEVELVRGERRTLAAPLEAVVGTIVVASTPPAELRIDRSDADTGPPDAARTPATFRLAATAWSCAPPATARAATTSSSAPTPRAR